MRLSLVAAVAENGVIGRGSELPWEKIPADMRFFRRLTMGHHLLMGRRTFDTLGGALPGRISVVITRGDLAASHGVRVVGTPEEAIRVAVAAGDEEPFVVGGGEIYRQLLPRVERMYITRIHARFAGDTFFPPYQESEWKLVSCKDHEPDETSPYRLSFLVYDRVAGGEVRRAESGA